MSKVANYGLIILTWITSAIAHSYLEMGDN